MTLMRKTQNITKYYSVIADSTPDLAHTDQLAIIVQYCKKGKIYERFLSFLTIYSHVGISLFDTLKNFLEKIGLPIVRIVVASLMITLQI